MAVYEGVHQAAFLPGADAPPGVVRVGERAAPRLPTDFMACSMAATASVKN